MTRKEAIEEINKVFEPAFANYIITALTEGVTVSDKALEQQPCEDCISRKAVNDFIRSLPKWYVKSEDGKFINYGLLYDDVMFGIDQLPLTTPKEKIGKWIVDWSAASRLNRDRSLTYEYRVHCDRCEYRWDYTTDKKGSLASNFCPNCGAKMAESEE